MHFGQQFTGNVVLVLGLNLSTDPASGDPSQILNDPIWPGSCLQLPGSAQHRSFLDCWPLIYFYLFLQLNLCSQESKNFKITPHSYNLNDQKNDDFDVPLFKDNYIFKCLHFSATFFLIINFFGVFCSYKRDIHLIITMIGSYLYVKKSSRCDFLHNFFHLI